MNCRSSVLSALFAIAAPAIAAAIPAQAATAPRQLELIDLFRLDFFMTAGGEEPVGWIDGASYAVFPGAQPGGGPTLLWRRVEAATGKSEALVDRDALRDALSEHCAEDELAAIDEQGAWTWNADYTRYVLAVGGDLWSGSRNGAPVRLTSTPDEDEVGVQFSPDGRTVAFIADYDLHVVPAAGGDVRALTTEGHADLFYGRLDWVYQEELYGRGNFQGYWWAPDGKHIALLKLDESPVEEFVLVRSQPARPEIERTNYPKTGEPNPIVEVGVIAVESGQAKWFDLSQYPADDRLVVRVTWHPGSAEVFLQVQNREQTWLDMLAGHAGTGAVRKLWREDSDCWVEAGPEPVFVNDGAEFLWLSERDGFKHIYHYESAGELVRQRTKGEWQVKELVAVDEQTGQIFALTDKDGPLETQLWSFALAGDDGRRLTGEAGTYEIDMAPDHASYIATWSAATSPPVRSLMKPDGKEPARVIAAVRREFMRPYGLTPPEFLQIGTRDGFPMEAMLFRPYGFEAGKQYPAVQFCYSGPHAPRVRNEWGYRDYFWHQYLAQRGYFVLVCDNRSASGKGRKFAKACWRKPGQSELQDLADGRDWLVAQGDVDPERVAIWGWSYGGYQTLYNLTHSTKWAAGVAVNPVTDWRLYDTIYTERYFGLPATNAEGYEKGSVTAAAGQLHGDLLLIAATMDDNVHVQNTLQLLHAFQKAGKDCDLMLYPEVRHGIGDLQQQLHLFGKFFRFLQERL